MHNDLRRSGPIVLYTLVLIGAPAKFYDTVGPQFSLRDTATP